MPPPQQGPRKAAHPPPHSNSSGSGSGGGGVPRFEDPARAALPPLAPPPPPPPAASHAAETPDMDFSMMDFLAQVSAMAGAEGGAPEGGGGGLPSPSTSSPFSFFNASFGLARGDGGGGAPADPTGAPREGDGAVASVTAAAAPTTDPSAVPAFAGRADANGALDPLNTPPAPRFDAHWRLGDPTTAAAAAATTSIETTRPNAASTTGPPLNPREHGGAGSWAEPGDFSDVMAFNFADVFAAPPPPAWGAATTTAADTEPEGESGGAAPNAATAGSAAGHHGSLAAALAAAPPPALPSDNAANSHESAERGVEEEAAAAMGGRADGRSERGQAPRSRSAVAPRPPFSAETPQDPPAARDVEAEEDAAPPPPPPPLSTHAPSHEGRAARGSRSASSHEPRRLAEPAAAAAAVAARTATPRPAATSTNAAAAAGCAATVPDPSSAALQQLMAEAQQGCARAAAVERADTAPSGDGGEDETGLHPPRRPRSDDPAQLYASDAVFFAEAAQVQQQVTRLTEDAARSATALQAQTSDLLRLLGPHAALCSLVGDEYRTTPVVHLPSALVGLLEELLMDDASSAEEADAGWTDEDVDSGTRSAEGTGTTPTTATTNGVATMALDKDSDAQGR